jgi:tetratricopeptide (TPR) repeat protein
MIGSEKLVRYSLLAGSRALASYAHEEALTQFERALAAKEGLSADREGVTDAETADILSGLGHAQIGLNRPKEAVSSLSRAFDYYVEAGDTSRAVAIAQNPHSVDIFRGMREIISRAVQLAPTGSLESGRVLSSHGYCLGLNYGDYESAQEAFDQALDIARTNNDKALEMRVLANSANIDGWHMRWDTCLAKCLQALELAPGVDDLYSNIRAHQWAHMASFANGDIEKATTHAVEIRSTAEKLRDAVWLPRSFYYEMNLFRATGRWPSARDLSDQGLAIFPASGYLLGQRALIEHQVGDVTLGNDYMRRFLDSRAEYPNPVMLARISCVTGNSALLDIIQGDAQSVISSSSSTPSAVFLGRCSLAFVALQNGDVSLSGELYPALVPQRGTFAVSADLAVDRLLGLLSQTIGSLDQATVHFEDALAFCRKAGYRPELAWTCCDYADTLLQRNEPGDREKVMSLLDESLAISSELGMRPLMERVLSRREILGA